MKQIRNWPKPALALLLGVAVLWLAVADYAASPASHKGIQLGPFFLQFPTSGPATAQGSTSHPTQRPVRSPGKGPGGVPNGGGPGGIPGGGPGLGSNGLKAPIIGLLDRGKAPKAAFYGVVDGYVVNAPWATLQFAAGAPIAAGNPIDRAIAQVRLANRSGAHLALKVRIFAGSQAPNWAKYVGGAPFVARDPNSGATGTVGRFWTPAFGAAYQDLENKLAAKYDLVPEIREVTIARCMTIYAETMIRQISDTARSTSSFKTWC